MERALGGGGEARAGRRAWVVCGVLVVLYCAVRLPGLRGMPVFVDETTYALWADLIYRDPQEYLWVSMVDAKLPLHYWVMALFSPWMADGILSGRVASVVFGAVMIPLLFGLMEEVRRVAVRRGEPAPQRYWAGGVAGVLVIFSPLVGLFQRMALAEPLLLMEGVAVAWWSLRFGRHVADGAGRGVLVRQGAVLGVMWGAMLVTKQNFSYLHGVLPLLGLVVWGRRGSWMGLARSSLAPLAVGLAVAMAVFLPILFAEDSMGIRERLFYKAGFHQVPGATRVQLLMTNLRWLLIPGAEGQVRLWPHDAGAVLTDGALYVYLTPPVFVLLATGLVACAVRGRWAAVLFFGGWSAALLGPLLLNANMQVVRYSFLGIVPLLLFAAWVGARAAHWIWQRGGVRGRVGAGLALAALMVWPAVATMAQGRDFQAPTLLAGERMEYLYRWSAYRYIEEAAEWLVAEARREPITVITGMHFRENDYFWLRLRDVPGVQLYWHNQPALPVKPYPEDSEMVLGTSAWKIERKAQVRLPAGRPVYRSLLLFPHENGRLEREVVVRRWGPFARVVKIFENPPPGDGRDSQGGLALLRIDAPVEGRK